MRYYPGKHRHTCGIDLHARSLYVCVLDSSDAVVLHRKVAATPEALLTTLAPYRDDLIIGCECMFTWYWLADLCADEGIAFVIGHALYMKAIHGAKVKNDRVDSHKIARLLRAGLFPMGYVYPKRMRATRDLLRRRTHLMRWRAQLLAHISTTTAQYNMAPLTKRLIHPQNRDGVVERFTEPAVQQSMQANLTLIGHIDDVLRELELSILRAARQHAPQTLWLLRTVPGIGKLLSLNILYEVGDINRFESVGNFASYCRLIKPAKTSDGKRVGSGERRIGNAHLRWSFGEAAAGFPRKHPTGKRIVERLKKRYAKRTMSVLAHKLGRAVYFMLKRNEAFDVTRLIN